MIKTALNCPNCGAKYNPAKMHCEFCGSFVVFPKEKMFPIPDDIVAEMKASVQQPNTNASKEQLGIYIYLVLRLKKLRFSMMIEWYSSLRMAWRLRLDCKVRPLFLPISNTIY